MKKLTIAILFLCLASPAFADEFSEEDVARWMAQFELVAAEGRRLWTSPEIGTNGVACAQCHPNGANTHPETYPKFQKQIGRVVQLWEMFNWCLRNPLEGEEMAADDPRMIAMQAYVYKERRGVKLDPGKH
jgi:thiosulfate dehydrogenase